jgi:hypothetical protein
MRAKYSLGFALLTFASLLRAQAPACVGPSTLVYADTVSFFLDAPRGWILDCNAGKDQGPLTVLYRVNESWRTGKAVMYATVLTDSGVPSTLFSKRVDAEVADWRQRVPDARVATLASLPMKGGGKAAVRRFQSPSKQLFEIVAYIPRGRIMPLLTMTARTESAFKDALPAFNRLVRSYAPGPVVKVP